jgi:chaperonin GroES
VNVGDSVLYGKYDGTELKYNDEPHQLIKDDDVLLKYSGNEATLDNVQPVKDQVLIELPPKESTSIGGIIVSSAPGTEKKRADFGTVVKIGPGRQAGTGSIMPIQVAPGDQCRFRDFAGSEVKLDGKDFLVIRAYDILAKW